VVKALYGANILVDCSVSADDHGVQMPHRLRAIAMMNADQKRASFSATLVFAKFRLVTNELEEARQYSILADGNQQDRCFLLSSYESVLLAHTMARLMLSKLTWKRTGRQPPVQNENLPASINS
jgi:hypothetical protein